MSSNVRLQPKDAPTENVPSTSGGPSESLAVATSSREPSGQSSSSSTVHRKEETPNIISSLDDAIVAFLADGKHIVSGNEGGKIQRWRVDGGGAVGAPMNAGSAVCAIAVSRNGRWIVSGTINGAVQVWTTERCGKVREIQGHSEPICVVDVSPDATKIVTGSEDYTARVWSLLTGEQLLGPWKHEYFVTATKFSPDGRFVATATCSHKSVRVYSEHGHCLFDRVIQTSRLAWSGDSQRLFALSSGRICGLDTSGTILWKWVIHQNRASIAVASNGRFITASFKSTLSFWDITTRQQIGSVLQHNRRIFSLAISDHNHLAIGALNAISICDLRGILPPSYLVNTRDVGTSTSQGDNTIYLENMIQQLRRELVDARRAAEKQSDSLRNEIAQLKQVLTGALQCKVEQWKSSFAVQEKELATAHETLEELRRNQSQSVQPSPSSRETDPTGESDGAARDEGIPPARLRRMRK